MTAPISRRTLLAMAAAPLAACARARPAAADDDTLVIALESGPLHLDPRVGTDQSSWRVHDAVFSTLVKKGEGGEFQPDLAESLTTEDGRVWNVSLRDGVRFHDGRALGAKDVAYTYESLLSPAVTSSKKEPLRLVERIEVLSQRKLAFHLARPYASFPLQLLLGIVPEGASTADTDAHPVGSGPFRLAEFRPDDRVVLERHDGWYGGRARMRRVVYRVVPDATTRALELLRGSLHLSINNLPPDLLPRFRRSPRVGVTIRPGSTYGYLAFNFEDPVLSRVEVRRALALALDREALVNGLWRGTVEKTETLLPAGHWARVELPPLTRDLAGARRLLDAAGFPDPGGGRPRLTLTYKTSTDENSVLQATAIAAQWAEAGVEAKIRSNDFAVFYQDVVKGAFQVFSLRWQGIVDPDHYHEVFLSTSAPPKGWNRGRYKDPEMDGWIEEARTTLDRARRRELYGAVQRRAAETLPYISLYAAKTVAVHDARLTGLDTIPPAADFTFLPSIGRG